VSTGRRRRTIGADEFTLYGEPDTASQFASGLVGLFEFYSDLRETIESSNVSGRRCRDHHRLAPRVRPPLPREIGVRPGAYQLVATVTATSCA
jgi:hypothetical protein